MDDSVTRRRLLRRGGLLLAGTSALAGCTEEIGDELPPSEEMPISERVPDLPATERTGVAEDGITAFEGVDVPDPEAFEEQLERYGIEIESVAEELDVLTVEYVDQDRRDAGVLHNVAPIAGAYASLVETDYEVEALEITILDPESTSFGAAEVETTVAERYNRNELTAKEYGELVAATIETRRLSPSVEPEPNE